MPLGRTVKNHPEERETPEALYLGAVSRQGYGEAAGDQIDEAGIRADRELVDRCLAGEVGAWEELYEQCHRRLLVSIEIMLGPKGRDPDLVDELAARVWYALVANDEELLTRYEPQREARVISFIRSLAKDTVSRYFRSERRRRKRERVAARREPQHRVSAHKRPVDSLGTFLDTLTGRQRAFCDDHLLAPPADGGESVQQPTSAENARKLSHRIRKRLLRFIDHDSP